jgi:hypothetical protein
MGRREDVRFGISPKGFDMKAQGNALGNGERIGTVSPEGAK